MTVYHPTYADLLRPQRRAALYDVSLILGGSLVVALSAQIAVRLPFSPVPVTLQTLAVLLLGMLLGERRGSLSLIAYLLEGAAGMPVFAGGTAGVAVLTGPTGGYLFGFVAAAYGVGRMARAGWDRHVITTVLAMLLGNLIIYSCGVCWLSTFVGSRAVSLGLTPFLLGDGVKIVAAALLLPSGWKVLQRFGQG